MVLSARRDATSIHRGCRVRDVSGSLTTEASFQWNPQIFTWLFIALAENKLYMMLSLWGEKAHIAALFLFTFSSAPK